MNRSVSVFLVFFISFVFSGSLANAQIWKAKRYEAVAGIGPSFFFGDIGGYSQGENILGIRDLSFKQTRFNINLNLKYRITRDLNARLSLTYGLLRATDERGSNIDRQMEASISIIEPAILGEFYFIKNKAENSYLFNKGRGNRFSGIIKSLDFYVFSGFGVVNYHVKANELLAAKGMDPVGFAPVIPIGLGSTLIYSPDFNFGLEVGGRYTFTDSLDNYTSQYSSSNDVYYFLNFTFTYKLKSGENGWPSFRR
jgi:hypothetical protein